MFKNLVVLSITIILISITGAFLTSWINHDRYNPVKFIAAETQSCKKVSDCTLFFAYCESNIQLPISTSNGKRYENLLKQHCEENPPKAIADFVESGKELACVNQVCSLN